MTDKPQAKCRVFIRDHTGNKSREARIAGEAPMRDLIPALILALRLPVADPMGRPVNYHVAYNDRQLQRDETLQGAGVSDGDTIAVVPEMTAGGPILAPELADSATVRDGDSTRLAVLSIGSIGEVSIGEVIGLLNRFDRAYSGILALELVLRGDNIPKDLIRDLVGSSSVERAQRISSLLLPSEHLVLKGVRLASPGFWEFLGKLNPLEVLRQFLADRHERQKDENYRNREEARRLHLENERLALTILRERIDVARALGARRVDYAPLINALVLAPLDELAQCQDTGLVLSATLYPVSTQSEVIGRDDQRRRDPILALVHLADDGRSEP